MADCLQKRIPVSQPTYCIDEATGEAIDGTIMYNWMHIRSVGPNCLKDTTLCGDTIVHGALLGAPPTMQILLGDLANGTQKQVANGGITDTAWHFMGEGDTQSWNITALSANNADNYISYLDDVTYPALGAWLGAVGFMNKSEYSLICKVDYAFGYNAQGTPAGGATSVGMCVAPANPGPAFDTNTNSLASTLQSHISWDASTQDFEHITLTGIVEIPPETGDGTGTYIAWTGCPNGDVSTLNGQWRDCSMVITILNRGGYDSEVVTNNPGT